MRISGLVLFCLMIWGIGLLPAQTVSKPDVCSLKGAVYLEPTETFATYRIFVEDIENFADVNIFKESTAGFANRPGHWYFTPYREFADFSVSIVKVKALANFSIFYTEFQSLAGCR